MPVVEKAFDGARQNPTKTTYVRRALVCISLRSDISTSMSNRKHVYWTFKCLPSLCLCDTRSHSNLLVVLSPSLIEGLHQRTSCAPLISTHGSLPLARLCPTHCSIQERQHVNMLSVTAYLKILYGASKHVLRNIKGFRQTLDIFHFCLFSLSSFSQA